MVQLNFLMFELKIREKMSFLKKINIFKQNFKIIKIFLGHEIDFNTLEKVFEHFLLPTQYTNDIFD